MTKVQIVNVEVLDNPSNFYNPFQFQITFDCLENLRDDLEWKIVYVGSAESEAFDQILDSVLVGPVPAGRHKFVFQAEPPKPERIPVEDVVGVTIVILTCTYHGHEFVRVGYYVNNEYSDPELRENPPDKPDFTKLVRNILSSEPRVTRFKINWDDSATSNEQQSGPPMFEGNVPPSPPPGVQYSESMLEDIQQAMCEVSKDSLKSGHDSNTSKAAMSNGENFQSTGPVNRQFPPCLENSIDAMEAQMLVE
uniref:Histone chaperone ASF1A-like n=1 Tax=Phallusia mammillata TaxID=59560 RepID=A0A6F9D7K4_9ASCI|nr:histone chaperone ASF1A-like [Phallusia mammillata]